MVIRSRKHSALPFTQNVSFMFVVYWAILVFWQNIGVAETRSSFDTIIKMGLLAYFAGYYLIRAKTISTKVLPIFFLAMSLMITAFTESQFILTTVVAYVYPFITLFLVYGTGDKMEITRSLLTAFCNCIICIVAYTVFYAMLFLPEQYLDALNAQYAYGNELSSFFVSNFEFGIYLVAAIVSCVLCLTLSTNLNKLKRILYIAAIVLFASNLILTFSRTTILSLVLFLLAYVLTGKGNVRKWFMISIVAVVLVLVVSPTVRTFVEEIVFKNNTASGRDVLLERGLQYFGDGTLFEKVFGHGIYEVQMYFRSNVGHSNTHNGYVQVLLYYGLIGCGALILFMLSQVFASIGTMRMDRHMGAAMLGLNLGAMLVMFTTTAVVFNSSIDSFFVTAFFVLMPKYVRNSLKTGTFYD